MAAARALGREFLVETRLITEADVPWLYRVCRARYAQRYDPIGTENWLRNTVFKQPMVFHPVRTDHAFCISMLALTPWVPGETECNVVFICCEDGYLWEAIHCLRDSVEWARLRNVKTWRLSSDTDYDLKMIARRLGCTEESPRYVRRF